MKRLKIWSLLMLVVMALPVVVACSSDDEEEIKDSDLLLKATGTWMCTSSVDKAQGMSYEGLMVGKQITIYSNKTYTSTAPTFGYSGSFVIKGNVITANASDGSTFVIKVSVKGDKMVWDGTASNGTSFNYVFIRE